MDNVEVDVAGGSRESNQEPDGHDLIMINLAVYGGETEGFSTLKEGLMRNGHVLMLIIDKLGICDPR